MKHLHQYQNKYINSIYATLGLSIDDKRMHVGLLVNGADIRLRLDTASDTKLISIRIYSLTDCSQELSTENTARNASGDLY